MHLYVTTHQVQPNPTPHSTTSLAARNVTVYACAGEGELMDWGDAVGLGAFAVIGAMNGVRSSAPLLVSALCGTPLPPTRIWGHMVTYGDTW